MVSTSLTLTCNEVVYEFDFSQSLGITLFVELKICFIFFLHLVCLANFNRLLKNTFLLNAKLE